MGFDTNQVRLSLVREDALGQVNADKTLYKQDITEATDLALAPTTVESPVLNPSGRVKDLILTGLSAGGSFGSVLSYDSMDKIMEGAMRNDWVTPVKIASGADISAVSASAITFASGYAVANIVPGMAFMFSGFETGTYNATFSVASVSGQEVTFNESFDAITTLTGSEVITPIGILVESGGASVTGSELTLDSGSAIAFTTFQMLRNGMQIFIGGEATINQFATAANNALVRIKSFTAATLTLTDLPDGWGDDDGTGIQLLIALPYMDITDAYQKIGYTVLESFLDHDPVTYQLFKGCIVGTASFSLSSQAVITSTINLTGTSASLDNVGIADVVEANYSSDTPMNTSSNVVTLREAGKDIGENYVTSLTIEVDTGLRSDNAIGHMFAANIGLGEYSLTGTLATYFADKTLVQKLLNNTETSLMLQLKDIDSQHLVMDLPRVKYKSGNPSVSGSNAADTASLEYQALENDYGYTWAIEKFVYLPE